MVLLGFAWKELARWLNSRPSRGASAAQVWRAGRRREGAAEAMILVSGEALIDLIPDPVKANAYHAAPGGSPFNVAIGLARLGSRTGFISRLSADANGETLAATLAKNGVDLGHVARDARPSALAFVMRGAATTESRYSFYLDATAYDGPWPFPAEWPKGARHLHIGSLAAVHSRHERSVASALAMARPHATVSFDPNIRPLVTPNRDEAARVVEREAALAHLVKASREDIEWLYPGRGIDASLAAWAKSGPRFCVATLGARGARAILGGEWLEVPARRVEVVDTVGAGDSFMSALLAAMDRDQALGAGARAPSRSQLERWLAFAAAASAITCARRGSDPPTRADVEAALARSGTGPRS